MRISIAIVAVLLAAAPAYADDVAGVYDVKIQAMTSDCNPTPIALSKGKLTIATAKKGVTFDISPFPKLDATLTADGKLTVPLSRVFGTTVMGLVAKYSATGEVAGGKVDVMFVANYIAQAGNKPHCKQPWKITGEKKP
jgi:hypothetical protein